MREGVSRAKWLNIKKFRTRFDSLDDRTHGCPILSQPEGTECASQRRAIYRCDFPRIAAGKPIFLHLGPSTEVSSSGGTTDNSIHRAWQALGIIILLPARDATQRRGAATIRQEACLGARGVTKTTTGTRTSKPQDSDPQAHKQPTRRHNRCKPDGRKHGHSCTIRECKVVIDVAGDD